MSRQNIKYALHLTSISELFFFRNDITRNHNLFIWQTFLNGILPTRRKGPAEIQKVKLGNWIETTAKLESS